LILPQIAESKSGFQLLGQGTLEEARLSTTTKPAQAIFLVMQTAVYDDAGPVLWRISVWRVTVLDSTRRVESRIPAKQI
jgi:hypothetical protein